MKLYIPEIGDKIVLTEDWTFRLFDERRNESLFKLLAITLRGDCAEYKGKKFYKGQYGTPLWGKWVAADGEVQEWPGLWRSLPEDVTFIEDLGTSVTLKAGQVLSIDRIYIRKGVSDFSSISFNYIGAPKGSGRVRFWAKLVDVNTIEFESVVTQQ